MRRRDPVLSWLVALSGAMGVAAGAFGAHAASGHPAELLRTGAEYQLIHAAAALAVLRGGRSRLPAWLFALGGFIFAGTLDGIALGGPHWLGAVTPIGGLGFIAGWLAFAAASGPTGRPDSGP